MKRREFITNLSLLSAMSVAPRSLMAMVDLTKTHYESFNQSLQSNPRLIGYQNYNQERSVDKLTMEGKMPSDINGTYYRNGPALFERDNIRYKHMFEGDGMIHAFKFKNGSVSYLNKFVKTAKFVKEQAAQKFIYDFGNVGLKDSLPITSTNTINTANTNVIPVGDDIWALWEAGSAHKMNAQTLATNGTVSLSSQLEGMPFSAHPKIDADGTIWNFGLDYQSGNVILYHLNSRGAIEKFGLVKTDYHAMLHDFLVTKNYILIILPSLTINPNGKSFMEKQQYAKDLPMRVLVIDKNDFTLKSTHEFAPCFNFHYGNAWEEKDGSIKFDGCRYANLDIMNIIEDVMQGKANKNTQETVSHTVLFSIHANGKTSEQHFDGISEFPRIYPSLTGLKNQKVFSISGEIGQEWMHSIRSLNTDSGTVDKYDYGNEYLVEEHVVIENGKTPQKNGYLIGTALHWPTKKSCVSIFAADNLAAGPIARAWLPFHIPLGFHGNFNKV